MQFKRYTTGLFAALGIACAIPCAAANWQTADNTYVRSPANTGSIANAVSFGITFDDQTGCPNKHYAFGLDPTASSSGRIYVGYTGVEDTDLPKTVIQTYIPTSTVPIGSVSFYCMDTPTTEFDSTAVLESGSPRFTVEYMHPYFVMEGGTGTSTFMVNGVLIGNGTDAIKSTAAGSAFQVLRVPSGGGMPSFGQLDLSQTAAATGTLPTLRGGTGISAVFTTGSVIFVGAGGIYSQNNSNFFWSNTNTRLGIGTNVPSTTLHVVGTVSAQHFRGISVPLTVATSSGICGGTSGTISVVGNDAAGLITLTTASSSVAANASCLRVNYRVAYLQAPHLVFSAANQRAAELYGTMAVYATSSASSFSFISGSTALSTSTVYKWEYNVIE